MSTSKLQRQVSNFLHERCNYLIRENCRPDWLISDRGTRLELDFYIEEIRLAVEVQGVQHYVYVEYFHKSPEGFKQRLVDDRYKRDCCEHKGIRLIEVSSETEIPELIKFICPNYKQKHHPSIEELKSFIPPFRRNSEYVDPLTNTHPAHAYPKIVPNELLVRIETPHKKSGIDKQGKFNLYTNRLHLWKMGELEFDNPKFPRNAFHNFLDKYMKYARDIDMDSSFIDFLEFKFPDEKYKEAFCTMKSIFQAIQNIH